jgi:hypothetical protein
MENAKLKSKMQNERTNGIRKGARKFCANGEGNHTYKSQVSDGGSAGILPARRCRQV